MKKASASRCSSPACIFGVLAAALLAVNLYVQSHGTQARIQEELSERLGATLHIQRISVTPWWGLKLTGITMPQDNDPRSPGIFCRRKRSGCACGSRSLFAQRLVIKEVSLINPKVVWAQNADGKWRLPAFAAGGRRSGRGDQRRCARGTAAGCSRSRRLRLGRSAAAPRCGTGER